MTKALSLASLCLFVLLGCESNGISTRDPGAQHTASMLSDLADRATTRPSLAHQQMKRPARVAVAQIGELAPPEKMLDAMRAAPDRFSSVQSVAAMVGMEQWSPRGFNGGRAEPDGPNPDRRRIDSYTALARQIDADYLLLVGGTGDTLEDATPFSVLDLTIVGMFIIPSRTIRGEVKAVAAAIDVNDGSTIMIQTAQANATTLSTAVGVDGSRVRLLERLRDEATVKIVTAMKATP